MWADFYLFSFFRVFLRVGIFEFCMVEVVIGEGVGRMSSFLLAFAFMHGIAWLSEGLVIRMIACVVICVCFALSF